MITVKHYTASWCMPCKQLKPIMSEILLKRPNVNYKLIDVDNDPDEASMYGVRGVPTVIFMKDGVEVNRITGLVSRKNYEMAIDNL
jgi:thioredoxin 1